jgi:hypothetical protein
MTTIPLALALGRASVRLLAVVAFLDASLWTAGVIAERSFLPSVVTAPGLSDAVAANEARQSVAAVGGPAIGGALFGLGRFIPFLGDSVACCLAAVLVSRIKLSDHTRAGQTLSSAVHATREGLAWLWRRRFLRDGALLYACSNLTLGSVELLAVLVPQRHGASSAAIGVGFALIGAGGVASAVMAGKLRELLSPRSCVLLEPWAFAAVIPLLALSASPIVIGLLVALALVPTTLSTSVVVARRITETPESMRGRVQASASFLAGAIAWLGPLALGLIVQHSGSVAAILVLTGWALLVALGATVSKGLRQANDSPASLPE